MKGCGFLENEKNTLERYYEMTKGGAAEQLGAFYYLISHLDEIIESAGEKPVVSIEGNRFVKCSECGVIDEKEYFASYGGRGHVNYGLCNNCAHGKRHKEVMSKHLRQVKEENDRIRKERFKIIK